ncbi:hypothetical protein V8E54_007257 [Elaphomyces granulatus]
MNGYRRRSSQAHDNYIINQNLSVSDCYDRTETHDFGYDTPSQYSVVHHQPFSPYPSPYNPSYSHPPTSILPSTMSSQNSSPRPLSQPHTQGFQHPHQYYLSPPRYLNGPRYFPLCDTLNENDVESQESQNEDSMTSEPVVPSLEGFPNVEEFDQLMKSYVNDLSVKKQDKALIHAKRARNIRTVLVDPKDTAVESAQFRCETFLTSTFSVGGMEAGGFWVKKMFKLQPADSRTPDSKKLICHEGKPVAIREKLFKILTKAHQQCQHGGRDKTSAQVRRIYSWVPKELISRFVKICPTCQVRRGGSHISPPNSPTSSPRQETASRSPSLPSPIESGRGSSFSRVSLAEASQNGSYAQNHNYVSWADNPQHLQGQMNSNSGLVPSFTMRSVNLLTTNAPASLNPLLNDTPGTPGHVSNYNTGYISTQGNPRHHNY